jgi:hypothetical protein
MSKDMINMGRVTDGPPPLNYCTLPNCLHRIEGYWHVHTELNTTFDLVNKPPHYTLGSIECIDAIEAQLTPEEFRGFLKGNIAKYLWRERHRNGKQDQQKALWYLKKLVEDQSKD